MGIRINETIDGEDLNYVEPCADPILKLAQESGMTFEEAKNSIEAMSKKGAEETGLGTKLKESLKRLLKPGQKFDTINGQNVIVETFGEGESNEKNNISPNTDDR